MPAAGVRCPAAASAAALPSAAARLVLVLVGPGEPQALLPLCRMRAPVVPAAPRYQGRVNAQPAPA